MLYRIPGDLNEGEQRGNPCRKGPDQAPESGPNFASSEPERRECRVAGQALQPAQPPSEPYVQVSSIRLKHRPAHIGRPRGPSGTAPAVDENASRISGGGVAVHHDVGIGALLEVRIEERLAGRTPAPRGYLGESTILH
jgi:hypothetical protein